MINSTSFVSGHPRNVILEAFFMNRLSSLIVTKTLKAENVSSKDHLHGAWDKSVFTKLV
jgi:hypothetical protein